METQAGGAVNISGLYPFKSHHSGMETVDADEPSAQAEGL